ncbi:hypothetical protein ScPMuIL_006630 [Solemya velum]
MYKNYRKELQSSCESAAKLPQVTSKPADLDPTVTGRTVSTSSINLEMAPPKNEEANHVDGEPANHSGDTDDQLGAKDLMISYSHNDKELMVKIRETLEKNGISVWVDVVGLSAGVDFLSKIGQAIIDAKLFISLVSPSSVKSKYCQDEVALAYIYDKPIFPVALQPKNELLALMDSGMRLQLSDSRFNWSDFVNPDNFDSNFQSLVLKLKSELALQKAVKANAEKGGAQEKPSPLKRRSTRASLKTQMSLSGKTEEERAFQDPKIYWEEHYEDKSEILWSQFLKDLESDFSEHMKAYTKEEQKWLKTNLKREMEVEEEELLHMNRFIDFCTFDGETVPFWQRTEDYMREMFAMKIVFSMNSTVRVDAIENLGKFRSTEVQEALRDLLYNQDANVRAVAAVSLAKSGSGGQSTIKHLMKCLNDKDRLVREAGCLALGHLKARQAISKLLHIWRNEVISHVREAAFTALELIGGEEVEKAMHVTKVLAMEIHLLTEEA